jgi:hypothetical protein
MLAGFGWLGSALAAPCIDTTMPISVEEQRLPNKLTNGNANPFAVDLLYGAGFTHFEADFITALGGTSSVNTGVVPNVVVTDTTSPCGANQPADFDAAMALMTAQGTSLWKTAVNRVQGRLSAALSGDLTQVPRSDDRPLYWARETMTRALNRWQPTWGLTQDQRSALQLQLERTSRGQLDINFLPGPQYKRLLMSSFDVFTLPNPGTNGTGMRNGNPSAATALSLDGTRTRLPDGTTLLIEVFTLPVNYPPFGLKAPLSPQTSPPSNPTNFAMQEETIGPYFMPGPLRVDASISMSQGGGDQFNLEQWNGRFHGPSAGNDNITLCPSANNARIPPNDDCDIYPPAKWLGYASAPWQKDFPPQFTLTSLPIAAMINAATGAGVPPPPGDTFPPANLPPSYPDPTGAFGVQWHINYTAFHDCNSPTTANVNTPTFLFPPATPPIPPLPTDCAQSGGGGNYLSNESAYRNTLMRDTFGLKIPAGHIHTPVMTHFAAADSMLITDAQFEAYRTAIVQQARNLVFTVARNLDQPPPIPFQPMDQDIINKQAQADASRISNNIQTLSNFGTRQTCSDNPSPGRGVNAARDYIISYFNNIAPGDLTVVNDPWTDNSCRNTPTSNVVAYLKGSKYPDRIIIVGGHYDSRTINNNSTTDDAPGSNDSGSQSSAVMELARILAQRTDGTSFPTPRSAADSYDSTLLFVTFSGEEQGTLGSQALASTNIKNYFPNGKVIAMLNNDIVGGDNLANTAATLQQYRLYSPGTPREISGPDGNPDDVSPSRVLQRYIKSMNDLYMPSMSMKIEPRQDRPGRNSDQTSWHVLGTPAVRFIETIECSPSPPDMGLTTPYPPPGYPAECLNANTAHQHSPFDMFQYVSPDYTQRIVKVEAPILASLARAPGAPTSLTVTGNGTGPLTVSWSAPTDTDAPAAYIISARPITEYFYRTKLKVPANMTSTSVSLAQLGLQSTETSFYISVAAVDSKGHESLYAYSEWRCTPTGCAVPTDAFNFTATR